MIASILLSIVIPQGVPPVAGQARQDAIVIPMAIRRSERSVIGRRLRFENGTPEGVGLIGTPGETSEALLPCGVALEAFPLDDPPHAYRITVDSNGDGSLEREESRILNPGDRAVVDVERELYGVIRPLRYELRYRRRERSDGPLERIVVYPLYHLEGRWLEAGAATLVRMHDFNVDGRFDWRDLAQGTAFTVDQNGDGEIHGSNEWYNLDMVFPFAGQEWVVNRESLSISEPNITVYPAPVDVARLNRPAPAIDYCTVDGATRRLADFAGRIHVVNFWRTSCLPCIAKLPDFRALERRLGDTLTITYYSTDGQDRVQRALEIAREHGLPDAQLVVQGFGGEDRLWQSIGSMMGSLAAPVYVVIDTEGVIRHASRTLTEVEDALKALRD